MRFLLPWGSGLCLGAGLITQEVAALVAGAVLGFLALVAVTLIRDSEGKR